MTREEFAAAYAQLSLEDRQKIDAYIAELWEKEKQEGRINGR